MRRALDRFDGSELAVRERLRRWVWEKAFGEGAE